MVHFGKIIFTVLYINLKLDC